MSRMTAHACDRFTYRHSGPFVWRHCLDCDLIERGRWIRARARVPTPQPACRRARVPAPATREKRLTIDTQQHADLCPTCIKHCCPARNGRPHLSTGYPQDPKPHAP
jgi:hypothetical protein